MAKGKLFVIEGLDGSGKQTQSELLVKRLKEEGYNVLRASYPNYKSDSSALVKMYLNGDFGNNAEDIDPKVASTFYAVDRYATYKKEYEEFYNNGGIILADRYTTSNMVHQAGKIADDEERKKFLDWLWDFEFNLYGLPVPTEVFFLNMPTEYALKLMENRKNKITNKDKKDIHERNPEHMKNAYMEACKLSKKYNWEEIKCIKDEEIRSIDDIHEEIYEKIKKYL